MQCCSGQTLDHRRLSLLRDGSNTRVASRWEKLFVFVIVVVSHDNFRCAPICIIFFLDVRRHLRCTLDFLSGRFFFLLFLALLFVGSRLTNQIRPPPIFSLSQYFFSVFLIVFDWPIIFVHSPYCSLLSNQIRSYVTRVGNFEFAREKLDPAKIYCKNKVFTLLSGE